MVQMASKQGLTEVPFQLKAGVIASEWVESESGMLQMRIVKRQNKVDIQIVAQGPFAHLFSNEIGVHVKFAYSAQLEGASPKTDNIQPNAFPEEMLKKIVQQKGKHITELFFSLQGAISASNEMDRQLAALDDAMGRLSPYRGLVDKLQKIKDEVIIQKRDLHQVAPKNFDQSKAGVVFMSKLVGNTIKEVLEIQKILDSVNNEVDSFGAELEKSGNGKPTKIGIPEIHELVGLFNSVDSSGLVKRREGFRGTLWGNQWEAVRLGVRDSLPYIDNPKDANQCKENAKAIKNAIIFNSFYRRMVDYADHQVPVFLHCAQNPSSIAFQSQINGITIIRLNDTKAKALTLATNLSQVLSSDQSEEEKLKFISSCEGSFEHAKMVDLALMDLIKSVVLEPNLNKYLNETLKQIQTAYDQLVESKTDQVKKDLASLTLDEMRTEFQNLHDMDQVKWTDKQRAAYHKHGVLIDVLMTIIQADSKILLEISQGMEEKKDLQDAYMSLKGLSEDEFSAKLLVSIYKNLLLNLPILTNSDLEKPLGKIELLSPEWLDHFTNLETILESLKKIIPQVKSFGIIHEHASQLFVEAEDMNLLEVKILLDLDKKFNARMDSIKNTEDITAFGEEIAQFEKEWTAALPTAKKAVELHGSNLEKILKGLKHGSPDYVKILTYLVKKKQIELVHLNHSVVARKKQLEEVNKMLTELNSDSELDSFFAFLTRKASPWVSSKSIALKEKTKEIFKILKSLNSHLTTNEFKSKCVEIDRLNVSGADLGKQMEHIHQVLTLGITKKNEAESQIDKAKRNKQLSRIYEIQKFLDAQLECLKEASADIKNDEEILHFCKIVEEVVGRLETFFKEDSKT